MAKKMLKYGDNRSKAQLPIEKTSHMMATHPVQFITTIGKVRGKLMPNVAPFATCVDTSYKPPYITFAAALKQHSIQGQEQINSKMNTYLNIKQNGLFIVNVPSNDLLPILYVIAHPYTRKNLENKIEKAELTKIEPFVLSQKYDIYPPMINECLAHLECEVIDIHRPKKSDHYLITGKVVGVSYDKSLGKDSDKIRLNLVEKIFHHFGASSENPNMRFIGRVKSETTKTITFKLEENKQ
jgi:flavin reductase (DIM6/NTAB) family NADH-FMN oxidoreductase RutF